MGVRRQGVVRWKVGGGCMCRGLGLLMRLMTWMGGRWGGAGGGVDAGFCTRAVE